MIAKGNDKPTTIDASVFGAVALAGGNRMAADEARHLAVAAPTAEIMAKVANALTVDAIQVIGPWITARCILELLRIDHRAVRLWLER